MKLSKFPEPDVFLDNERATLKLLSESRDVQTYYPKLYEDVRNSYAKIKTKRIERQPMDLLNFESYMDIKIDKKVARVFLGGEVKLGRNYKIDKVSYYFAICKNTRPSKVMRRFHFDYDSGTDEKRQSVKPFYHIQYGGKMTPRMLNEGWIEERHYQHIDSWLELPRISHTPMTLLFLVFLIIKEIDEAHTAFLNKPEWHARMRKNEKIMLRPFYETCTQAINNDKSIFLDCYY